MRIGCMPLYISLLFRVFCIRGLDINFYQRQTLSAAIYFAALDFTDYDFSSVL